MRLGVHISISKSLAAAAEHAGRLGCETIQMFSSNPSSWRVAPLDPAQVEAFKTAIKKLGIHPITLHTPYLLNLASGKEGIWHAGIRSLTSALDRASLLGADYVVTHIGSHGGAGLAAGADRIKDAVSRALDKSQGQAMVLLEAGSGAGNTVGSTFEELSAILERLNDRSERVGVCLDAAHLWGAGYDISSAEKVDRMLSRFDKMIGLDRLLLFHLNDTQVDLGSHRDRHWHIGQGNIGIEGFRAIVNHPALKNISGIIETPEMELGKDVMNLNTLKSLRVNQ